MELNMTFDKYEFSEPFKITKWKPLESRGLYVILEPDLYSSPLPLKPIYFGQTGNFAERGFIKSHEKYKDWIKEVVKEEHLFIAIYLMPGSTEEERKDIESKLIDKYHPVCND